MEKLQDAVFKRPVLAALADSAAADELCRQLSGMFDLTRCGTADEAVDILDRQFATISAAIVSAEIAEANDCALLKALKAERALDTIPVLVAVTETTPAGVRDRCIDEGAVDVIELPCATKVLHRRIGNAVQLKRSATFFEIESMLKALPSMIFLKDAEGRYVFNTHYWHHLDTGGDPKWTIRGKTDLEVRKDRENAIKAMEADREILRTGKGTSYVIEINTDGVQDFVQLIKEPVFDESGNVTGIIALGNDVTESELMKQRLRRYALMDELTGVGNRRAYSEFLESIPERDDFPIAVISADLDCLKNVNDTLGHLVGDEYIHMAALILQGGVPDEAPVFRTGGDEFVAFVPRTTADQAEALIENMRHKAGFFRLHIGEAVVSYGVSCIGSADADVSTALDLADQRMYADKASHKA